MIFWFAFLFLFLSYVRCDSSSTVIVVTGSSTGIGKAIALDFAKLGSDYKIYATMRNPSKADSSLLELNNIEIMEMDVSSDDSVNGAIHSIINREGHIDILVNNAGYGLAGSVETCTIDEAKSLFDINVFGIVRVLQAVLPYMRKLKNGHIINISSTSGIRGIAGMDYYTGSKFALEGITDSLRYTLGPFNIAITNINAGPVKTAFMERFGQIHQGGKGTREIDDPSGYLHHITNMAINALAKRMDSGEAQTPDDVAAVVLNVHRLHLEAKLLEEIPFNVGTSSQSMAILDHIKKYPTGWGGMYSALLKRMPTITEVIAINEMEKKDEL